MEPSQKWYIYMRNQKLETELAYKSAKCNTLRQCGVITDLPHFIHNQQGVLFVAHKAITVRTSVVFIPFFLMYNPISTGVLREGRKITTTRKHLTISFGVRRKRYKTDKKAFLYMYIFQNILFILVQINGFQTREFVLCLPYLFWILFAKPEIHRPDVFV